MADDPYKIKVQITATIDGVDPVTETVQDTTPALVKIQWDIPPGQMVPVRIMPERVEQPTLLVVKPLVAFADLPSQKPNAAPGDKERVSEPITTALPKGSFWYSTVKVEPDLNKHRDQWKPLLGGHVFVNGMAEWVTDMVAEGVPGPLTTLWFWNAAGSKDGAGAVAGRKVSRKKKDKPTEEDSADATITVLIVVGYSPKPDEQPPQQKRQNAGNPG